MNSVNPRVDLLLIDSPFPQLEWDLGNIVNCSNKVEGINKIVINLLQNTSSEWLLFWGYPIYPNKEIILELVKEPVDIIHSGLKLGVNGKPELVDFVRPSWMFSRDPDASIKATSWRISLNACMVRCQVLRHLDFLNEEFLTIEAAALEWGHRCIQQGVMAINTPILLPTNEKETFTNMISFYDELFFIFARYGFKWAAWATFRAVLSGYTTFEKALSVWRKVNKSVIMHKSFVYNSTIRTKNSSQSESNVLVTVLIPTIDRYAYLHTLLKQLEHQTCPAHEILVVDQSYEKSRQAVFYSEFSNLPLKVTFLDHAGQCSSRNHGLRQASGDFILFLDDDDEILPDLIQRHLENFSNFDIDASCGVADEVGAGPLPKAFTLRRASDVFPTNNSMLRRSALRLSGLFDLAYEHGPRADGDLGMRLYLSGARMLLDPEIRVLHHHAPRGGLRTHKARRITYASSRSSLLQRNIPSVTELYLVRRYFSSRQVREHLWMSVLGTFSLHGSRTRKIAKILISAFLLPHTLWQLWRGVRQAEDMLVHYPQIPLYLAQADAY